MKRQHDATHLKWIATLPCLVCADNTSAEAAHIRRADPRFGKRQTGIGEKSGDIWVVPLCSRCHRRQHAMGEAHFWQIVGIDPFIVAIGLAHCAGDINAAEEILRTARNKKGR